jgi:hypothetical protein
MTFAMTPEDMARSSMRALVLEQVYGLLAEQQPQTLRQIH